MRPTVAAGAAFLALMTLACTTSRNNAADGAVVPPEELDVEDPDPSDTGPKFCNPAGKKDEDLSKCLALNEAIYREFDDEAKAREPWFEFTPDSWVETPELDPARVQPALRDADAVERLQAAAWVALSPADAARLTGKPASFPGTKPYLLRALYYYRESGRFAVYRKGDQVLVRHDSEGKDQPRERRTGVVVHLERPPTKVYVDCGLL